MLAIEVEALENGAHRNQTGDIVPEGYIAVPPQLEEKALEYLPFILLDIEDGELMGVSQGEIPEPEPEAEPEAGTAQIIESLTEQLTNAQLALCEIYELISGGDM